MHVVRPVDEKKATIHAVWYVQTTVWSGAQAIDAATTGQAGQHDQHRPMAGREIDVYHAPETLLGDQEVAVISRDDANRHVYIRDEAPHLPVFLDRQYTPFTIGEKYLTSVSGHRRGRAETVRE